MSNGATGSWPPLSVHQRMSAHRSLVKAITTHVAASRKAKSDDRDAAALDDEIERSLARFLTIRSAGFIEAVRDDVADCYADRVGHPRVRARVAHGLRRGEGVHPGQLEAFIGSFDQAWKAEFTRFLEDEDRRDLLAGLVDARKKVAHGDGEQVTILRSMRWSDTADEIVSWIVEQFRPAE